MKPLDASEIERGINAQNLVEISQTLSERVNGAIAETTERLNGEAQTTLNPLTTYCQKTGQPIGTLSADSLMRGFAVLSRAQLADALYTANCATVHPVWQQTASNETIYNERLDALCEADPQAYAVYAIGKLCAAFHRPPYIDRLKQPHSWADFHWSKARAYQIFGLLPRDTLTELCDIICHFARYNPRAMTMLRDKCGWGTRVVWPEVFAQKALKGSLIADLEKAIDETITKRYAENGAENRRISETNLGLINDHAKGPSDIKRQRLSQRHAAQDKLAAKLKKKQSSIDALFRELGAEELLSAKEFGKESWRKYIGETTVTAYEEDDSDASDFVNALNDIVEMRTISREQLQAMHEMELVKEVKAQEQAENPAPKLTLAQRIARNAELAPKPEPIPETPKAEPKKPSFLSRLNLNKKG